MGVAIISAVGLLVAAVITSVVSLVTANEKGSHLLKEAETLSKLEPGSVPHTLMEQRLVTSIVRYGVEADAKWNHGERLWLSLGAFGGGFALAVWIYVGGRFDVHTWQLLYNLILGTLMLVTATCAALTWFGFMKTLLDLRKLWRDNAPTRDGGGDNGVAER